MWLENLKELRKTSGLTIKQIADRSGVPGRSVERIFAGETECPRVETLHQIVKVLGGSLDAVLAGTQTVVSSKTTAELHEEVAKLTTENEILKMQLEHKTEMLKLQMEHKEEMAALHKYYLSQLKTKE